MYRGRLIVQWFKIIKFGGGEPSPRLEKKNKIGVRHKSAAARCCKLIFIYPEVVLSTDMTSFQVPVNRIAVW